jgi:hypothetical protein
VKFGGTIPPPRSPSRTSTAAPCFPFVSFNLLALSAEIRTIHFPDVFPPPSVGFFRSSRVRSESLASVIVGESAGDIRIHEILNRSDTPREVIEHILKHELLHIVIRPRSIAGHVVKHPPEFWEAERRISPQGDLVWNWLYLALISHLKIDKKREATTIKRGWESSIIDRFPTLDEARDVVARPARTQRSQSTRTTGVG